MTARPHVIQKASAMAMGGGAITQITSRTGACFTMMEVFQILDIKVAIVATMTVQSLATMEHPTRLVSEKLRTPISDLANAPGVTESPLTAKSWAYQ